MAAGTAAQSRTHVPVHQVEVKVVGAELLECVLEGELDVLGVVVQLEELGGDPDLDRGTPEARIPSPTSSSLP